MLTSFINYGLDRDENHLQGLIPLRKPLPLKRTSFPPRTNHLSEKPSEGYVLQLAICVQKSQLQQPISHHHVMPVAKQGVPLCKAKYSPLSPSLSSITESINRLENRRISSERLRHKKEKGSKHHMLKRKGGKIKKEAREYLHGLSSGRKLYSQKGPSHHYKHG